MHAHKLLLAATLAAGVTAVAASASAGVTITSLTYYHSSVSDCEDTVANSTCAPIGVTKAGATNNQFLNDLTTKAINLGPGAYYTFGNPWAPTQFMIAGDSITAVITLSNGATLTQTTTVPDLSVAGVKMFDFGDIDIVTTGITNADRISFGNPPTAFQPDANLDYVLQLNFVPEPAIWLMMLLGLGAVGVMLRTARGRARASTAAA